ncbi:MAG TPA: hypothetical protein VF761_04985 [Gemmatimonadaceae bacterium]
MTCVSFVMPENIPSVTTTRWPAARVARVVSTTALLLYGIAILRGGEFAAIDNVNLPIHETGHIVFGMFGELITAMGGSLFQVIVPLVFVGYFLRRREQYAASVALWWVAENLWYVATYVADAQEQALPLVGGGEHDWAFILAELDVLRYDDRIAAMIRFVGIVLFVIAILWGYASADAPRGIPAASESSSLTSESPK